MPYSPCNLQHLLQTLAGRNLGVEEILGSGSSKIMSSIDASWDRAFRNWKVSA